MSLLVVGGIEVNRSRSQAKEVKITRQRGRETKSAPAVRQHVDEHVGRDAAVVAEEARARDVLGVPCEAGAAHDGQHVVGDAVEDLEALVGWGRLFWCCFGVVLGGGCFGGWLFWCCFLLRRREGGPRLSSRWWRVAHRQRSTRCVLLKNNSAHTHTQSLPLHSPIRSTLPQSPITPPSSHHPTVTPHLLEELRRRLAVAVEAHDELLARAVKC